MLATRAEGAVQFSSRTKLCPTGVCDARRWDWMNSRRSARPIWRQIGKAPRQLPLLRAASWILIEVGMPGMQVRFNHLCQHKGIVLDDVPRLRFALDVENGQATLVVQER